MVTHSVGEGPGGCVRLWCNDNPCRLRKGRGDEFEVPVVTPSQPICLHGLVYSVLASGGEDCVPASPVRGAPKCPAQLELGPVWVLCILPRPLSPSLDCLSASWPECHPYLSPDHTHLAP